MYASSLRLQFFLNNANKLSICDDALKKQEENKSWNFFHLGGILSNTWCASAASSTSELSDASVAAAAVERPASFFPLAFVLPEPSAALFFFAEVLPFFGRAALGSFDGAAAARDGAGATPPGAVVIRGGKKRLRARPTLGGAPAVTTPTLPALGFPAATGGGGVAAVQRGERGAGVRVHGWQGAGAGARGGWEEERRECGASGRVCRAL